MINVLYILGYGGFGGIERHVQCLLESIDRTQINPSVCVIRKSGPISDAISKNGVPVYIINAKNGHDFRIIPGLHKILHLTKPHLIHAHETAFLFLFYLKFYKKIPLISSIHCPYPINKLIILKMRLLTIFLNNRIDYFLPVSLETFKSAIYYHVCTEKNAEVFYNPVIIKNDMKQPIFEQMKVESFNANREQFTHTLGMVGRMVEEKGWESFLNCSRIVLQHELSTLAFAIGDGPLKKDLEQYWKQLCGDNKDVFNRLVWTGFRDDAKQLIGGLDVFLLTSNHEELPTTLLEAFVMRTMVVGFIPVGGVHEILSLAEDKKIGLFQQERSVLKLAESVLTALYNPKLCDEYIKNAFDLVDKYFNAEKNCQTQLMDIYIRMLSP